MLAILALTIAAVAAMDEGPVNMKMDGQDTNWEVLQIGYPDDHIQVNGDSILLKSWSGLNFAKYASDSFNPDMWEAINPVGKRIEYDVDLNQVGCSCNACVTLVGMPGHNQDGSPAPAGGNYYCDANKVGGTYCPEFDIAEMNKYALVSTAHKCNDPQNNWYDWCDGAGMGTHVWDVDNNAFCPEDHCTINTSRTFHHGCNFIPGDDGVLNRVACDVSQDDKTVNYDIGNDSNYLRAMD